MRMFVIADGIVENIIEAGEDLVLEGKTLVPADGVEANIGWAWNDGEPTPPEAAAPPLADLSRPAFLFMMGKLGISKQDVYDLIDQMPDGDEKTLARIVFDEQQTFRRDNALLAALAKQSGLSEEQIDAAWRIGENLVW